LIQDYLAN